MTGILSGKVLAVTGGASGIGRAIALRAAEHGAKAVIVADLQPDPVEGGESTVDLLKKSGAQAVFIETNVSKVEDNDALVARAEQFGGLDVMVANAGITAKQDGVDIPSEEYHRLISVNLDGALFGA